jgi:hypothetical protein
MSASALNAQKVAPIRGRAIDRVPRSEEIWGPHSVHPDRRSGSPASLIVNCEPDGRHRVVGPGNAMTHVGADVNIAAGFKQKRFGLTFEN